MSLFINGRKKNIVDRTISELLKSKGYISRKEILYFSYLLNEIGIDYIEIDKEVFKRVGMLQGKMKFIYRVKDEEDIRICIKNKLNFIVIEISDFMNMKLEYLNELIKKQIIFEIKIEDIDIICKQNYINNNSEMQKLMIINKIIESNKENYLRIQGISRNILDKLEDAIKIIKESLRIKVDICPENNSYIATAIALEALEADADSITLTFTGKGSPNRFAALEEVILALKVIKGYNMTGKTWLLSELFNFYKKITKEDVSSIKSVLGEDIFKYESGIHVDGINKNPSTYEPYDPKEVGQDRRMILGKHSGSKSIINKLIEMNLDYKKIDIESVLEKVRNKSIQNRGEVMDEELIRILNSKELKKIL